MNAETLTALQGSIAKWEAIVAGWGEDNGSENCPLCDRFAGDIGLCQVWATSEPCPVAKRSMDMGCHSTPFDAWHRIVPGFGASPRIADTPERKAAAKAELDFLKSLLPEDK